MKNGLCGLFVLALCTAAPLLGTSTFYVGLVQQEVKDQISYETELSVSNPSAETKSFSAFVIPSESDGTVRSPDFVPEQLTVPPFQTRVFTIPIAGQPRGMVEIQADEDLAFRAELVPTVSGMRRSGIQLPIVTSQNLIVANEIAYLQGVSKAGTTVTNLGVINLSHSAAECTYNIVRFDGLKLMPTAILPHPALSQRYFPDVLGIIEVAEASNARIHVTCNAAFFVAGDVVDQQSGALSLLSPSQTGFSALNVPGEQPDCPSGAVCFDLAGTFYIPTNAEPRRRLTLPVPAGRYRKAVLHVENQHGGWRGGNGARFQIFWLVANARNQDMLGTVLYKHSSTVRLRHGIDQNNHQRPQIDRSVDLTPGKTYTFDYVWDAASRDIDLVVQENGQVVATVQTATNVGGVDIGNGQFFTIDLSFTGDRATEPASIGWPYRNLHVEFYR